MKINLQVYIIKIAKLSPSSQVASKFKRASRVQEHRIIKNDESLDFVAFFQRVLFYLVKALEYKHYYSIVYFLENIKNDREIILSTKQLIIFFAQQY